MAGLNVIRYDSEVRILIQYPHRGNRYSKQANLPGTESI